MHEQTRTQLNEYVTELFAPEDDALRWIQAEAARHELPGISIRPFEGRLLQLLLRSIDARSVVEIGTLAGYSGVWIARALSDGGRLYTLEKNSKHAAIARASFERAEVQDRVELLEGDAFDTLKKLSARAPFDFVFLDAQKTGYLDYLDWAAEHLRPGGMVAAHNAFRHGRVLAPENDEDHAMRAFNQKLANDPRFESGVIGTGDGMAVGIKRA